MKMALATEKTLRFPLKKLIKKQVLQQTNLIDNNNKFYIAELWEGDQDWCIKTDYGRTGVTSTVDYRYGDSFVCQKEFDKIIASKEKKGYKPVETEDVASKPTTPKIIKKANTEEETLDVSPNILKFIEYIFGETTSYVQKTVQTPVGKLSQKQISHGKEVLKEIENLLTSIPHYANVGASTSVFDIEKHITKAGKLSQLQNLCSDYYSAIPQKLGHNIRGFEVLIKNGNDLAKQEDILQALQDLLGVQEIAISDSLKAKYESFEAKFSNPDKSNADEIAQWFNKSKSKNHSVGMKILDVFCVKRDQDFKRWDENIAKIKTVQCFHGTRNQNLLGICSRGLIVPGKNSGVANGANFGVGIYGAIHSSKSAQYCGSGWRSSGNQYMFVMDLAVGKQHIHKGWVHGGWSGIPANCHSTWAQSDEHGGGLAHDELIVYKENQARLTHIISFESRW